MADNKNPQLKIAEAESCHLELNRLYGVTKEKVEIVRIGNSSNDSKQLKTDVKEAQRLLRAMQVKIAHLKSLSKEVTSSESSTTQITNFLQIPSLNDRKTIEINVLSHEKQMSLLQKKLKEGAEDVGKDIAAEERRSLLLTKDGKLATGNIKIASHEERATRLQDLLARMSQQVDSGEQAMSSLVHSSSVLGQTHAEYDNQKGHIMVCIAPITMIIISFQTGNKLLSKYEQREFTEKILLVFFFLFYFGVVYYILQKRIFSWFKIF
ncbi:hypothetical protein CRE_16225 [Caenorhabditis remanei]|uniref:Sec20 C-terminal domain-containing protein n=1 Tax=Caenorhabditis remanei TaxID=31234 RepID=E3MSN6_CAERE|nr:hypothetical protein CRE_16225 [Caenorhabditis remanei]